MLSKSIKKAPDTFQVPPNLLDYDRTCASFSWTKVHRELIGDMDDNGINIAYLAVDRHAHGPISRQTALRWLGNEESLDYTYGELQEQTNRFASLLCQLGISKGDIVCSFCDKIPALYFTALGSFKNLSTFCPLFSAFGPEALYHRLHRSDAKVLVTTTRLYQQKIKGILKRLPKLQHVLLTDASEDLQEGLWSLPQLMAAASPRFTIAPTNPEDMALLHFTSGTTGMPKGALHAHNAVLTHYITGKYVLDFHPDDVFWCTADPGWVTGISYGIIAPLVCGVTNIIDGQEFDAMRWYQILEREKVNIWYTSPTAIRRLMRMETEPRNAFDLHHLRSIHSVGEPLNPEAVCWGQEVLGRPIHDNWWQTETGGIMIANYPVMDIRPGSMGRPLPGIEAVLIKQQSTTERNIITEPGEQGELALKSGWPSMFSGYLHDKKRYQQCFIGDYYLTGDLAHQDSDGYFWFIGRADDIIKTSGHLVSPFEVESTLMTHPAVAEAGVIGKPHPLLGELVKAFVVLRPGFTESDELRLELIGFSRRLLGPAIAPREIECTEDLPKNKAGKIMRRLLKARECGLPEGDISTIERNKKGQ